MAEQAAQAAEQLMSLEAEQDQAEEVEDEELAAMVAAAAAEIDAFLAGAGYPDATAASYSPAAAAAAAAGGAVTFQNQVGLPDIARHVIRYRLTQETRVQNASHDVACQGPGSRCSPRRRTPCNSII